ncbi:hypothetical protein OKW76_12060 [Sphingomonas sp. S1-29]|uniref:hypothetical protein n=1 Tax=Sphingomonas sp. S1-29 TaxID=2991074 RepID=UPI002240B776|nr:hypothetical protein [Sphingomonas sp. S1-29]UZK68768.1 hypothetical protein OKW76_12060 [Sphingomonas sp. S1-29]
MIQIADGERRHAFSHWLRTGRMPAVRGPDGIELKFNPWHDPADGRFTFAGAGRYYGAGGTSPSNRQSGRGSRIDRDQPEKPRAATKPRAEAPRPVRGASYRSASRREDRPNPVTEFAAGVGEGVYDVAEGTVTGAYAALTTNPLTTLGNAGRAIAETIDTAIAAEDTPARVQISRAADAIANATPREIGRATGSVAANAALIAAPGAALGRISSARRLRQAQLRPTFDPPKIGWVRETVTSDKPWKAYNDSATGGRPGQAPVLVRTMPDGTKRPVKFDGIDGDYVIDRKWSIWTTPRARAQVLRQAQALAEHRQIGIWEVPNLKQRAAALKLLRKMKITRIKVRVVEP